MLHLLHLQVTHVIHFNGPYWPFLSLPLYATSWKETVMHDMTRNGQKCLEKQEMVTYGVKMTRNGPEAARNNPEMAGNDEKLIRDNGRFLFNTKLLVTQ